MSPLTYLSRVLLVFTCLLALALTGAGIVLIQQRYELMAQGMSAVEAGLSDALGVRVSIGQVQGPFWSGFELRNIRIYGSRKPDAPLLGTIPRVRAFYSLLEVLKLGKQPVVLEVHDPELSFSRDARGQLNYQPTFKKGPKEPPRLPKLPPIRLQVHKGSLHWQDRLQGGFESTWTNLQARCSLVNKRLVFEARTHEGPSELALDGSYLVEAEKGTLRAQTRALPTARWINYLAPNPQMRITGGEAEVETQVSWAPNVFKLQGALLIHRMSLEQLGLLQPVEDIEAIATFDNKVAQVSRVTGTLCGNRFQASGQVLDVDRPIQRLDFKGDAQSIDLVSLVPLVPDLANFHLSGKGSARAVVTGTTLRPVVDAQAHIPAAHVLEQQATNVTGTIHMEGIEVDVPVWQGSLNGGRVTGSSWFTLEVDPRLRTDAHWSGVQAAATLRPYLKQTLPLRGELTGDFRMAGTASDPHASGSLAVEGARYHDRDLPIARADFSYQGHVWQITDGLVGFDEARLHVDTRVHEDGVYAGRFSGNSFPLSALRSLGVEAPVTGTLVASGSFAGDAMRPGVVQAHGVADVANGTVMEQTLQRGHASWALAEGKLSLHDVGIEGAGGTVKGQAWFDLGKATKVPVAHAEFVAEQLKLEALEPVQVALAPQIGALQGTVAATGSMDSDGEDWRIQAETTATAVEAERLGTLRRVAGPLYFGHQRLSFPALVFAFGKETSGTLQGSLDFTQATPAAELELAMHNAPARDIETAVHWQELLQGTWIGKKFGAKLPMGPRRNLETLSGIAALPASSSVPLKRVLDHWARHHLEPLASGRTYQPSIPFWQATEGFYNLDLALEGPLSEPEVRLRLGLKDGKIYGHPMRTARLVAVYRDKHLHVPVFDAFEARDNGVSIQARGVVGADSVLAVYGHNLDLSWANPYLQAQEVELQGHGSFTLLAKGDPSDPRLEIAAGVSSGSIGPAGSKDPADQFTFSQADARATYYRGRMTIDSGKVLKDGKEALVSGGIPVLPGADNRLDLSIDLQGESLGIVSAFTRGEIQWKGGPGRALLKLEGTMEDPQLSGSIDLQGVALHDRNLKNDITDIRGFATITTDAVTIQRATAHYGGGTLVASGQLYLKKFVPDRLRLQAVARDVNFELTNGLYKGMVVASLEINGSVKRPVIGGTVAISRGTIDLDALTPAEGNAAAAPEPSPIELDDLSLRIHQGTGVTLLGPKLIGDARWMEVPLDGGLVVNGMLDNPQAKGTIFLRGGTFTLLNSPFDITSGTVDFLGVGVNAVSDPTGFEDLLPITTGPQMTSSKLPNARLNIVARGQVYDYNQRDFHNQSEHPNGGQLDIKATITGSLQNMERKFECPEEPQLSQERIEQVLGKESLVTGIINGEKLNSIVTNEVSGFLSTASRRFFNPFTSQLQELLKLEAFGFDLESSIDRQDQAMFSALAVSPSFYTETRTFFGGISLSGRYTVNRDRNTYQAGLNYRFNDHLSLQAGVDNRKLPDPKATSFFGNTSITLTTQRRF